MDAKTVKPVLVLCSCLFGLVLVACNAQQSASSKAESAGQANAKDTSTVTTTPVSTPLIVGTWYGKARLDMVRVQQRYDSMTNIYQRQDFQDMVNSFLSTEMAARFDGNGSMELDVQIQPAGQEVARGNSRGQWRILDDTTPGSVLLETVEYLPNGLQSTDKVRYTFGPDGNVAYMVAGVNQLLADCNPLIVFDRVSGTNGQLANQPGNSGSFR
jgi:hypothetical protein